MSCEERHRQGAPIWHQTLTTYGIGADLSENQWRAVLRQLVALGYIVAEGEFNTLALTDSARAVLRGEVNLTLREAPDAVKRPRSTRAGGRGDGSSGSRPLALGRYQALKAWRAEVAREHNLPAYVVFHDATLADMARIGPQSLDELGTISGGSKSCKNLWRADSGGVVCLISDQSGARRRTAVRDAVLFRSA